MSVENNPNSTTIPTLDVYDHEMHNLDHLHVKLFQQLNRNTEEMNKNADKIKKLQQFQRKVEQSKQWLVDNNSKEVSTIGLGQYKCAARKKVDEKVEKCLTWLILKYNKTFRCCLSKAENALIKREIEEYKLVKNEVTKSTREIPIKKEDGTTEKTKKIKIKVLKTPYELRREMRLKGALLIKEDVMDMLEEKKSCCVCKCCDKDKKGKTSAVSIQMNKMKQKISKMVKKEIIHTLPLV